MCDDTVRDTEGTLGYLNICGINNNGDCEPTAATTVTVSTKLQQLQTNAFAISVVVGAVVAVVANRLYKVLHH
ncbi:10192_t:CDS:2 [Ambispora leptoticha]|uniref:10192_t:CDS:1 n=1 Tax=Ambispora leptoticha TaxID=144679 RepID=A0A9N9HZ96_9GLOM|nr:10192_t:CDS:2 [Ambispora leptoticha]